MTPPAVQQHRPPDSQSTQPAQPTFVAQKGGAEPCALRNRFHEKTSDRGEDMALALTQAFAQHQEFDPQDTHYGRRANNSSTLSYFLGTAQAQPATQDAPQKTAAATKPKKRVAKTVRVPMAVNARFREKARARGVTHQAILLRLIKNWLNNTAALG